MFASEHGKSANDEINIIEEDDLYFITNNPDGRGNPAEDDDKLYRLTIVE